MGRHLEFDEEAVLDQATECFWESGYATTSVRDLVARTGLTAPSLYNAYGDKSTLFRTVLNRYFERMIQPRIDDLSSLPPLEAIRSFLNALVERSVRDPHRRGCLLINSAIELAPHDHDLSVAIRNYLARIEIFFRNTIEAGRRDGTVWVAHPDDAARLFLNVVVGIRVLARSRPERPLLEGIVRAALATIERSASPQTRKSQ